MNSSNTESNIGEIILYQPNESLKLEVQIENETVWLTQQQMAELFQTSKQNVSLHVNNIFKEEELPQISVVKESLTTAADGKKYKTKYYNLDVIISVGYRVKSQRGTQFRIWATQTLKEHLLRGYSINREIIQQRNKHHRWHAPTITNYEFIPFPTVASSSLRFVRINHGLWINEPYPRFARDISPA